MVPCILYDHCAIKLKIDSKQSSNKCINSQSLNSLLLNDELVKKEIKKEMKRFLELNKNENITGQNLWDALKAAILTGKSLAPSVYTKISERSLKNDLG